MSMMNKYVFQIVISGLAICMLPLIVLIKISMTKTAAWADVAVFYSFIFLGGLWFAIIIAIYIHDLREKIKLQKGN